MPVCVVCVQVCLCMHAEVRGQHVGVGSFFQSFGSWELNSGCQAYRWAPLLTEPSHRSLVEGCFFFLIWLFLSHLVMFTLQPRALKDLVHKKSWICKYHGYFLLKKYWFMMSFYSKEPYCLFIVRYYIQFLLIFQQGSKNSYCCVTFIS